MAREGFGVVSRTTALPMALSYRTTSPFVVSVRSGWVSRIQYMPGGRAAFRASENGALQC